MEKEAPEQTTVSGQKPLSVILDEIEERQREVNLRPWWQVASETRRKALADVPALVKVVQHLRECIKAECSGVVAQACDIEVASILNQK